MRRKVNPLCDHDVREIVRFQKYLDDMHVMPLANFYARYQEYMGLSDTELKAILKKSVTTGVPNRWSQRGHHER